jgi:D-alanyl-D-alanine dipeptidase
MDRNSVNAVRLLTRLAFLAFFSSLAPATRAADAIPPRCRQIVLVIAAGWDSPKDAFLRRYSRPDAGDHWLPDGGAIPVLIGEHGLGWASGLRPVPDDRSPRKREGDRRSPAGIFQLTTVFSRARPDGIRMPFLPITPATEAIDDQNSRYYNQIVERSDIAQPDWRSSEKMARISDYALCIAVGLNPAHQPGGGSCVFLHVWSRPRAGTAGCTALHYADLLALARWLDPAKDPILIQAPREAAVFLPASLRF